MKLEVAALLLVAAMQATAQDCVFDLAQQERDAQALAASHRGAIYDSQTHVVRWHSNDFGTIEVRIGGCQHFGLSVTARKATDRRLTQAQALVVAKRLVAATWPKPYARDAAKFLAGKAEVLRQDPGATLYQFKSPGYMEFTVQHSHGPGGETITVGAIGEL